MFVRIGLAAKVCHQPAIIVPEAIKELIKDIAEAQTQFTQQVPVIMVSRKNFEQQIKQAAEQYKPVAVVMMTFPFIIPEKLLQIVPKGFINFHYGRLPDYRGPEPIFTQIIRQEKQPGLTVHVVTGEMDAGPVILEEIVPFDGDDTYGMLQQKLANTGAKLINLLIKVLSYGSMVPASPQDEAKAQYHKKPTAGDLMIDWQKMDSSAIKALVNACNPWNKGCGTIINDRLIGITEVEILNQGPGITAPGTILAANPKDGLLVSTCDNNIIRISIAYTPGGFISGAKLAKEGLKEGDSFK